MEDGYGRNRQTEIKRKEGDTTSGYARCCAFTEMSTKVLKVSWSEILGGVHGFCTCRRLGVISRSVSKGLVKVNMLVDVSNK
jgi:hypothetical protein